VATANRAALSRLLQASVGQVAPAIAVQVRQGGEIIHDETAGCVADTLFDLASLTKLWTVTAALRLAAAGKLTLDQPVSDWLPDFTGERPIRPYENPLQPGEVVRVTQNDGTVDAGQVRLRQLMIHTSGLPAWRPIYLQPAGERRRFVLDTFFSYPTGTRVVYSDLGLILLAWALEQAAGQPLAAAIARLVTEPLRQDTTAYGPITPERTVPTEFCRWRGRRIRGEVHDENAYSLDGVAGHAGLFAAVGDVAELGQAWLDVLQGQSDFLPVELAREAIRLQAEDGPVRRGLGWALWSPSPESASHPLSQEAFGHTGFTGTSLYIDPARELVIACLTNEVYNGRENRLIGAFRLALHETVCEEIGN